MDDMKVLDPKPRKFEFGGRTIEIRPLVLKKYSELWDDLAKMMDTVIEKIPDFEITDPQNIDIKQFVPVFLGCGNSAMKIISVAINEDIDFILDNVTAEILSELLPAIIEVNGFEKVIANFSKEVRKFTKKEASE